MKGRSVPFLKITDCSSKDSLLYCVSSMVFFTFPELLDFDALVDDFPDSSFLPSPDDAVPGDPDDELLGEVEP